MQATTADAFNLLMEGSLALAQMESAGIRIDVNYLDRVIAETGERIKKLQDELRADPLYAKWRRKFGDKTNLGSREQLGKMLFDVLELPYRANFTNTGRYRTDDDVLLGIDLPFVKTYTQLEDLKKLKSTFLEGIRREEVDGYLHPVFNLHLVETYRSSSDSINFQNLPIRDAEMGKTVRQCFIPRKGRVLVEIDYVGIEVRVSACYNKDPVLIEYIKDPTKDMHRDMAAQCYKLEPEQVSKQTRYVAKNQYVFPQFYGSVYFQCAPALWEAIERYKLETADGLSLRKHLRRCGIKELGTCDPKFDPVPGTFEHHVREVERDFWGNRFCIYAQWKRSWYDRYLRAGEFEMLTGFRCSGVYRRNEVLNFAVQGSAFHCLLWSLIRIQKELTKRQMKTKLVGQIHDSLITDVPIIEVQDYIRLAERIMTRELPKAWKWLCVPLEIEVEVSPSGETWFDKVQWLKQGGVWQPKEQN